MEHLSQADLESLVMGEPLRDPDVLRRHVAECPSCARRLRDEARLELVLWKAAQLIAPSEATENGIPQVRGRWRALASVAATLLVVFAVSLALTHSVRAPVPAQRSLPSRSETSGVSGVGYRGVPPTLRSPTMAREEDSDQREITSALARLGVPSAATAAAETRLGVATVPPADVCRFVLIRSTGDSTSP